jgi:tetratricopeptide (TPR) repeat protein
MAGDVGSRIRKLRLERAMSQAELASDIEVSGSYLSLIESGRRPASHTVMRAIAVRLGCSLEFLQTGLGGPDESSELDLRFAEMALRNGDTAVARERFAALITTAEERNWTELGVEARWGLARTQEAQGHLETAIDGYEALLAEARLSGSVSRARVATALCRAYNVCGDLDRAIDVGESAITREGEAGIELDLSSEVDVALVSTLVGCYYERGDLTRAHALAKDALARAGDNGLPLARAAALWNAGLVAEARGDLRTARRYVDSALALYSESDNARAVALLKIASAWLLLREPEPPLDDAERLLESALAELPIVGSQVDIAYGETELARCRLLEGDWVRAVELAEASLNHLGDNPRLEAARARLVLGHARLEGGDVNGALDSYSRAAAELKSSGARRQAASAWRELAESLVSLGRSEAALEAYREATDAAGVSRAPEQVVRRAPHAARDAGLSPTVTTLR